MNSKPVIVVGLLIAGSAFVLESMGVRRWLYPIFYTGFSLVLIGFAYEAFCVKCERGVSRWAVVFYRISMAGFFAVVFSILWGNLIGNKEITMVVIKLSGMVFIVAGCFSFMLSLVKG